MIFNALNDKMIFLQRSFQVRKGDKLKCENKDNFIKIRTEKVNYNNNN